MWSVVPAAQACHARRARGLEMSSDVLAEPAEAVAVALATHDRAHEDLNRAHAPVRVVSAVLARRDVVEAQ